MEWWWDLTEEMQEFINAPCYVALAVLVLSILYYFYSNRNIPPGPVGLPYLGYFPYLDYETCHLQLAELGKKYGDVFSFRSTGHLFINLGSVKAAREAHITKSDCFTERPKAFSLVKFFLSDGFVFQDSEKWRTARKFFLQQFRERGMNTVQESLSGPMYQTIRDLVADLKTKPEGEVVDIGSVILSKTTEIMRLTLFNSDGMTEEELMEYTQLYIATLQVQTSTNTLLYGNMAKYLLVPWQRGFRDAKKCHHQLKAILKEVIRRRRRTFDDNNVRDCLDAFFKEGLERKANNDPLHTAFTDDVLMGSLIQIVGDGVLFLSIFIGAFLKAVLDLPEEQENIYQELMQVVGANRDTEMQDKSKLPYTNAFITEVMRTSNVIAIFPSLECTKETTLGGYRIPKGAITLYNFWMAHMNPHNYEEPEKFNPSRFIVQKDQKKPDYLPLFGMGKRSCIGEGYVMIQVFLFLTTILKHFRLQRSQEAVQNVSSYFQDFNVRIHPRS